MRCRDAAGEGDTGVTPVRRAKGREAPAFAHPAGTRSRTGRELPAPGFAVRSAGRPSSAGSTRKHQQRSLRREETNMPGGDRTGPVGQGPRTGRAMGYCAGADMPESANSTIGWGRGGGQGRGSGRGGGGAWGRGRGGAAGGGGAWGRGGGRGWRHWFHATGLPGWLRAGAGPSGETNPNAARDALRERANALRSELEHLERQLSGIDREGADQASVVRPDEKGETA